MCQHFLQSFAERDGVPEKRLTRAALDALMVHLLPGNVRELEHLLLQAWVMAEGNSIDVPDLRLDQASRQSAPPSSSPPPEDLPSLEAYRETERRKILAALEENGWNRARAAKALGMPRRTFYRRLQDHSIL